MKFFKERSPITYSGWEVDMSFLEGVVEWAHPNLPETNVYATPYYDGENTLPIDYHNWGGERDDYENISVINLPKFTYEWEFIDWMESEYFKLVNKKIINYLGPLPE